MLDKVVIFPWSAHFETGIPLIDEQHKKLVDLLNDLVSHLAFQSDAPTLEAVFETLREYIAFHFSSEEQIWQEHFEGDSWQKWHAHAHGDFVTEIAKLKAEGSNAAEEEVIERIVSFLTHWLAQHILESDKRMAKVVLALPSGISLERAKEVANEEMTGSTRLLIDTIMGMYDKLANTTVRMSREIQRRQLAEVELEKARQTAEAANLSKTLFLANMSHEIRAPLNTIIGFSEIMRRDASLNEVQQQNLAVIHKSGSHLLGLVNGVLDMAKIETGHLTLEPAPFDFEGMIADITDMLRIHTEEKGLQLRVEQSFQFPRFMVADEVKLRQILINLITNAINATQRGGVVLRLGLKHHNEAEHLLIEVEDSGRGIDPEDQARIMEPFVQAGGRQNLRGTGLGLAISRRFVELMGGSFSFASTVGQGSIFQVDIPVRLLQLDELPESLANCDEVTGLAPDQAGWRVLVAEDHAESQLLLMRMLDSVGFEVRTVENGAEALEQFQAWQPHFIWMDRYMPVMDGLEATRRIRAMEGGDKVKIAAVTASTRNEDDAAMKEAGCDAIIHKPFRSCDIFECMERLLSLRFERRAKQREDYALPELSLNALFALSAPLRKDLEHALLLLDSERIASTVNAIAAIAPELGAALSARVRKYDYTAILVLLQQGPPRAAMSEVLAS